MGRRSKLDDVYDPATGETRGERIVALIRGGNYAETAARACGVDPATYYRWMEQGDTDAPTRYREFREAVLDAKAAAESRVVLTVNNVIFGGAKIGEVTRTLPDGTVEVEERFARPDGRLGLEYLSRTAPTRFARREQLAITGDIEGGPVRVEDEGIRHLAESLDRYLARGAGPRSLDPPKVIDGEVVGVDREPTRAIGTGEDDGG